MARRYAENDTPWDNGAPAPPLVDFLRESRMTGRILVPGCGKGSDVYALAAQAGISAVGLDLSSTAIAQARERSSREALGIHADFIAGDFFQLPPELKQSFDWVMEHTCFCAIHPAQRPDYVAASVTALRPGGRFFGIFYLNPDTKIGPPFAVSKQELAEFFDPHFILREEWVPKNAFPGRENRELIQILQKR